MSARPSLCVTGVALKPCEEHAATEAFAFLMSRPIVNPERQSLRDAVPYSAKKLETLARKLTTPTAFSGKAPIPRWWEVTNKEPIVHAWARGTVQRKPNPFESGRNVLPGLEQFATENGVIK